MATLPLSEHLAWRGGTTAGINNFAGVDREFVIDTTKHVITILSGTAGENWSMAPEGRVITAGSGVTLSVDGVAQNSVTLADDFTVSADLTAAYAVNGGLTTDANDKLKLAISLSYNSATGKVAVLGADGTTEHASVIIPSHTSALAAATVETATAGTPVNEQLTGTFLHFVWNLTNGTTTDTYIDVTTLIDVYTAGNGLQMNAQDDHKFEVKAGNGIEVDANGVHAKVKAEQTLLKNGADGLYVDETVLDSMTAATAVSADTGNILVEGSDEGAYLKLKANGLLIKNASGELEVITDFGVITE